MPCSCCQEGLSQLPQESKASLRAGRMHKGAGLARGLEGWESAGRGRALQWVGPGEHRHVSPE